MILAIFLMMLGLIAGVFTVLLYLEHDEADWFMVMLGIVVTLSCIATGLLAINNHYKNQNREQQCVSQGFEWEPTTQKCFADLDEIAI